MKIKRLSSLATIPTRGSKYAAGYDLYAAIPEAIVIPPHSTTMIGTGWAIEIPEFFFGAIFARSGLAAKEGLRPANCVGVIDSDYRGEILIAVHNDTNNNRMITPQERVAQLVIMPYKVITFEEVDELKETERGIGGFGSTNK